MTTHKVGPYTVIVDPDYDCGEQPFEWEEDTTFGIDMSNHRQFSSPSFGGEMPVTMGDWMDWSRGSREDCEDRFRCHQFSQSHYILPVFMFEHSGRTVSTTPFSCRWDSGLAGFVYVEKNEFARSGIGSVKPGMTAAKRQELAYKYLRGQVAYLDDHMTGNIWGYRILDESGDEIEACYGFIGDEEYCEAEALREAKSLLAASRKARIDRLRVSIKNRIPAGVRLDIVGVRP